jgi:hypothetical protein
LRDSKFRFVFVSHAIEAQALNVANCNPELESAKAEQDEERSRDELGQ